MKKEEETAPVPFLYFLLTLGWSDLSKVDLEQTGPEMEREKRNNTLPIRLMRVKLHFVVSPFRYSLCALIPVFVSK